MLVPHQNGSGGVPEGMTIIVFLLGFIWRKMSQNSIFAVPRFDDLAYYSDSRMNLATLSFTVIK